MSLPAAVRMCLSKNRWGRRERAEKAASRTRTSGRDVKVYRCPLCQGWHLTSRVKESEYRQSEG